jgi:hypothetical protein
MGRIKGAWRVLTGRSQALDISEGTADLARDMAEKGGSSLDYSVALVHEFYAFQMSEMTELRARAEAVVNEAERVIVDV